MATGKIKGYQIVIAIVGVMVFPFHGYVLNLVVVLNLLILYT